MLGRNSIAKFSRNGVTISSLVCCHEMGRVIERVLITDRVLIQCQHNINAYTRLIDMKHNSSDILKEELRAWLCDRYTSRDISSGASIICTKIVKS